MNDLATKIANDCLKRAPTTLTQTFSRLRLGKRYEKSMRSYPGPQLRRECQLAKACLGDMSPGNCAVAHSVLRASQVWLCLHQALCLDVGICHELSDEYALEIVRSYACLDGAGLLLKFIKEQSAYCSARGLGQAETNIASVSTLLAKIKSAELGEFGPGLFWTTGWIKKRLRWIMAQRTNMSSNFREHIISAAQNVLYIKRGCPPAEPWEVEAAIAAHETGLTRKRPDPIESSQFPDQLGTGSAAWSERSKEVLSDIKGAISAICRQLFHRKTLRPNWRGSTQSATFEHGRQGGGGLAAATTRFKTYIAGCTPLSIGQSSALDSMHESAPGRVVEVRRDLGLEDLLNVVLKHTEDDLAAWVDDDEVVRVLPAAVVEPCKVRMITLGSELPLEAGLILQQFLWRAVKECPTFEFTGKPITEERFAEVFPPIEIAALINAGNIIVSGDYTAATDNLNPELSEAVWDAIAWNASVDGTPLRFTRWYQLGLKLLTKHRLYHGYTRKELKSYTPGEVAEAGNDQQWGQLMGSPMSFPILNIVNAAATAVALGWRGTEDLVDEEEGVDILDFLEEHHVRTNGDDILFLCPAASYETWKRTVTIAGLSPSLGKNYTSDCIALMNSELRYLARPIGPYQLVIDADEEGSYETLVAPDPVWRFVSFCNLPILFGMEAKGTEAGQVVLDTMPVFSVGPLARAFVRGADPDVARRRTCAFVDFHKEVLDRAPAGCAWDVPQALGGLGLPQYRIVDYPSNVRLRAAWLACLDPLRRIRAVTPTAVKPAETSWCELAVKSSMVSQHKVERISSKTFFDDDGLTPNLKLQATSLKYGRGTALANYLRQVALDCPSEAQLTPPRMDKKQRLLVPTAAEMRRRAEFKFSHDVARQVKLACKTSLHPMTDAAIQSWGDHRTLVEVDYDPSYGLRLRLV